jgi:putative sterol carrier protein
MQPIETLILPQTPPADQLPPDLRVSTRYRVKLEDGRSFMLSLDQGRLTLREGTGQADAVISCTMEQFRQMLSGQLNMLTAFMRGEMAMSGDLEASGRLYQYLRLTRNGGHP